MNDHSAKFLESVSFSNLHTVKEKPNLSFLPLNNNLTNSLGSLININELSSSNFDANAKGRNARDSSRGHKSIREDSNDVSQRFMSPVRVNDSPLRSTVRSFGGDFESDPEYAKMLANYKIKAR